MDLEPFVSAFGVLASVAGATWYLGALLSEVRSEVRASREDVAELREDVQGLRQDVGELRGDVIDVRAEVRSLDHRVRSLELKTGATPRRSRK